MLLLVTNCAGVYHNASRRIPFSRPVRSLVHTLAMPFYPLPENYMHTWYTKVDRDFRAKILSSRERCKVILQTSLFFSPTSFLYAAYSLSITISGALRLLCRP